MKRRKYIKMQLSIGIVCLVIGLLCLVLSFVLVNKFKSLEQAQSDAKSLTEQMHNSLKEENFQLKKENDDLKIQLMAIQNDVEQYRKAAAENGDYEAALLGQLERAEVLAGLTDVHGEGIRIVLTDSEMQSDADDMVEDFIIHDSDLRLVITELAAAGGEAFSINGQRIVSTSPIRCVGPVITVNEEKMAPPFEILAVGDKQTLAAAVTMRGGIADLLSGYGIGVIVEEKDEITVTRYAK